MWKAGWAGGRCLVVGVTVALSCWLPSCRKRPLNANALYRRVSRSVVTVVTYGRDGKPTASGSGVVIDGRGSVLTNYHVVQGGTFFDVRYADAAGKAASMPARPIKAAASVDLAELAVTDPRPFSHANLASGVPAVGTPVFALGSPLTLQGTLSEGIVSQIRSAKGADLIQTTAAISPGSSGGGLFLDSGDLVGITSMTVQGGQNLNFAISVAATKHLKPCDAFAAESVEAGEAPTERIKVAGIEIGLGMKKEAVLSQIRSPYGWSPEFPELPPNFPVFIRIWETVSTHVIGSLEFTHDRVSEVSREWLEQNPFWARMDRDQINVLMNAGRSVAGNGLRACTLEVLGKDNDTSHSHDDILRLRFSDDHVLDIEASHIPYAPGPLLEIRNRLSEALRPVPPEKAATTGD
jgi:Trypsin-like peptidase domain